MPKTFVGLQRRRVTMVYSTATRLPQQCYMYIFPCTQCDRAHQMGGAIFVDRYVRSLVLVWKKSPQCSFSLKRYFSWTFSFTSTPNCCHSRIDVLWCLLFLCIFLHFTRFHFRITDALVCTYFECIFYTSFIEVYNDIRRFFVLLKLTNTLVKKFSFSKEICSLFKIHSHRQHKKNIQLYNELI